MFVTLAQGGRPGASELRLPPNGKSGDQFNSRFLVNGTVNCTLAEYSAAAGAYEPKSGLFRAWAGAGCVKDSA